MQLSLYIVTQNEEDRLPATLAAAAPLADEIVIVDSGSSDGTETIAARWGARFVHHDWLDVGDQVRFAERQCAHEWVLRLDADEVLTLELFREIEAIKKSEMPDCDGYRLRIADAFPGAGPSRWVKHFKLIRLYDRRKFSMAGRPGHDDVDAVTGSARCRTLRGLVAHYSCLSINHTVDKYNQATDCRVRECHRLGKTYAPWRMVGASTLTFLKSYLLGRFFLLGWWGFIHSVNLGYLRFLKFAKWYESDLSDGDQSSKGGECPNVPTLVQYPSAGKPAREER